MYSLISAVRRRRRPRPDQTNPD